MKSALTLLVVGSLVVSSALLGTTCAADDEQVTIYPAYGYQDGDHWVIPMRLWVHERRGVAEVMIAKLIKKSDRFSAAELANFRARIREFVADSESGEAVVLGFDNDPKNQPYRLQDSQGGFPKSGEHGLVEGVLKLPLDTAQDLLSRQGAKDGWLSLRAVSKGHSGQGRVRLVGPAGLSVISDIDDTVKITEVPAGKKTVIRNTFFRDFAATPDMAAMYRQWKGASFHYVSGSPWQLSGPLAEFLFSEKTGFPEGTFHLRDVARDVRTAESWEDMKDLVTNENVGIERKVTQISEIMRHFPQRKFILVGDSGEKDPEVYREIKKRFPDQVQEIRIRDVVNDRQNNKPRLDGMTIIPAPTVTPGLPPLDN